MPLVAPGICRYSINGTINDRPCVNILDMQIDTTGSPISRNEAIENAAEDILNNWCDHILPLVQSNYTFVSVSWVDLDEPDGGTGTITSGGDETLPQSGTATGSDPAGSLAILVKKNIANKARNRRNGRMYIAGLGEESTEPLNGNLILNASLTAINTALASFRNDLVEDDPLEPLSPDWQPVVVHTETPEPTDEDPNPEPVYVGYSPISSLVAERRLATQRRRLRG